MTRTPDAANRPVLDNFGRHLWEVIGATMGVGMTAFFGWPVALGWLIGYGGLGLVFYALVSSRLRITIRRLVR